MNVEAVKARCAAATIGAGQPGRTYYHPKKCACEACIMIRSDLPDAIELIEEAEDLLLDARPVIGGDSEAKWCKKREAFFAKVRPK